MEITRTINSDKRYYLDEGTVLNADSLIDTISRFNQIQMQMYNLLYDKKYNESGILTEKSYSEWCKEQFNTNDYYNCAIYTKASGMLSSQKELRKIYVKTKEADLKARDAKIKSTQSTLDKKLKIKASLLGYLPKKNSSQFGSWKTPYSGYQGKITGKTVILPGRKTKDLYEYELMIDKDIRRLKTRLRLLRTARDRAQKKLDDLKSHAPKRIIFGTKKLYSAKDENNIDMESWRKEFSDKRYSSMSLPGRHTSKNCNFLVRRANAVDMASIPALAEHPDSLIITCMNGTQTVLLDFKLARGNDLWLAMLNARPDERKPVCYNFQIKKDRKNRIYLIVSVTITLENKYCNESLEDGCISIDLNYDHVAVTDIDKDGNRISGEVIRFNPDNRTSGQISDEIGRVMSKVGKYCEDRKKPLVMEDLDTTISKHGMKYDNAKGNKHASIFAYRKMTACLENQSYERSFGIIKINPAYTSQIGKILYMRKLGISIHEAASYAIGLKGMEICGRLIPPPEMVERLSPALKDKMQNADMQVLMEAWKYISNKLKGIFIHSFYRKIPYEYKDGEGFTKTGKPKKPKSLNAIANEMKFWTARYC